jgi:hypothetical protein
MDNFYAKGKPLPERIEFDKGISNEDIDIILNKVNYRARSKFIHLGN